MHVIWKSFILYSIILYVGIMFLSFNTMSNKLLSKIFREKMKSTDDFCFWFLYDTRLPHSNITHTRAHTPKYIFVDNKNIRNETIKQ